MHGERRDPLVTKIDCIQLHVADLQAGLAFYRDRLGHELIWLADRAVGLRLPGGEAEIVLQTERAELEVDLKVRSADAAAVRFQQAGGTVVVPPFDIQIGRAAVVEDPWGNRLVLLDASKGLLITDTDGRVVGNAPVGVTEPAAGYDDLYEEALRFAARAHCAQVRKGTDVPYITHPMHVSAILLRHGFETELAIAGLLHDVVEDQGVALEEIVSRFGLRVAEIVAALSERKVDGDRQTGRPREPRPWHVRKQEAVAQIRRGSAEAAAVKAADVLHNVRSIVYDVRRQGNSVWHRFTQGPGEMLEYYAQVLDVIRGKLGDHALVGEVVQAVKELSQIAGPSPDDESGAL
jgi:predicted enzyme related to lactoylglutathione lyase